MPNLSSVSRFYFPLLALPFIFWAANAFPFRRKPNKTKLVFYVHDYLTGHDASALTVAGRDGPTTSILQFGTLLVVDDKVTEGPDPNSKEIGRAQGMYLNSQLDGKGLHMVFSVIFTQGEYKSSTLEIQGADLFSMKEREFSVVSGTGYFRFVRGYGIMTTHFLDIPNLRASTITYTIQASCRQEQTFTVSKIKLHLNGRTLYVLMEGSGLSPSPRLLAMIGEQFDHGDEICGAVVNVRSRQEKIAMWTKNAANEAAQVSIGKQWKEFLDYKDPIGFIFHEDAKTHDKSAKNRYMA